MSEERSRIQGVTKENAAEPDSYVTISPFCIVLDNNILGVLIDAKKIRDNNILDS